MFYLPALSHPSHNHVKAILTLVSLNDMFGCLLPREKIMIFFSMFYGCVVKVITCF